MVSLRRRAATVVALLSWVAGAGCTTLREIPRSEYTAEPELRAVRLLTADSLEYEFDFTRHSGDTLTGFRRQDISGPAEQYATLELQMGEVRKLSVRRIDWTRTGLVGGLGALIVASAGLAAKNASNREGNSSGSPGGGRVP